LLGFVVDEFAEVEGSGAVVSGWVLGERGELLFEVSDLGLGVSVVCMPGSSSGGGGRLAF